MTAVGPDNGLVSEGDVPAKKRGMQCMLCLSITIEFEKGLFLVSLMTHRSPAKKC